MNRFRLAMGELSIEFIQINLNLGIIHIYGVFACTEKNNWKDYVLIKIEG